MSKQAVEKRGPLMRGVVEGKPIRVAGRELVPVVRLTTHARRRASVGTDRLTGQGWGFVHMQPVAILERDEAGERRIPIQDKTPQVLSGLLLVAFIIPLLLAVAVRLTRTN